MACLGAPRGRQPRLAAGPCSCSSAGSVESSSGPTGVWLPEAHALEGTCILSGAQPVRFSLKSKPIAASPAATRFRSFGFLPQRGTVPLVSLSGWNWRSLNESPPLANQVVIAALRTPSPPSARGAVALPGGATLVPSLGATGTVNSEKDRALRRTDRYTTCCRVEAAFHQSQEEPNGQSPPGSSRLAASAACPQFLGSQPVPLPAV